MQQIIKKNFEDSIETKRKTLELLTSKIEFSTKTIIEALENNKKVLICGNGGSAADAQHFSAELVMRFERDRRALPAISLTTDSSNITAGANDFGYQSVFKRQVEALGNEGDVLVGITTSGNSESIIKAFEIAKLKQMKTICLNGKDGGKINNMELNHNLVIPSLNTARIQETHITIIHTWCKLIEDNLFFEQ
tara:strand:+ start:215 stop:793 length:579 start_codon:yes stop_codon:yes gene_type:complete